MCDLELPQQLERRLKEHPSGVARGFSPKMSYGRHRGPAQYDSRHAAVMLLLYRDESEWHLPLTRRQANLSAHAGQICLPGGSLDGGETIETAALRELEEELGVPTRDVRLVGQLAELFVFNSNFRISPLIGFVDGALDFLPNPGEVAEVLRIPLRHFCEPDHESEYQVSRGQLSFTAPSIEFRSHQIWGATRVILADFLSHVRACRRQYAT